MKKFPFYRITPHIKGSKGTFDDTFMDAKTTRRILEENIILQEKIDGINLGAFIDKDGVFYLINKDKVLQKKEYSNYKPIIEWYENLGREKEKLIKGKYAIFGEYIINPTSKRKGINRWIIIDAIENSSNKFISYSNLFNLTKKLKLEIVPIIFKGKLKKISNVQSFIENSSYYTGLMEGVCIRLESNKYTKEKYKFVRSNFIKK